jgi:hypothetical protein
MRTDCKTRIQMEEMYAMMSIPYRSLEEKNEILKTNDDCIRIYNMSPDIYIKPYVPGKGKVVIEFRSNDRTVGEYFNYLIADCELEVEID